MRKELYDKLTVALRKVEAIRHIDLWNRNVEFIDQETAWERPAVFIEFEPVSWVSVVPGHEYRTDDARVRLHIVTDWLSAGADDEANRAVFDLPDRIHEALAGLEGESFGYFTLVASHTNHDHEDIVESVEVFSYVAYKHCGQ